MFEGAILLAALYLMGHRINTPNSIQIVQPGTVSNEYIQPLVSEKEWSAVTGELEQADLKGLNFNPLLPVSDDEIHEEFQAEAFQPWRIRPRTGATLLEPF